MDSLSATSADADLISRAVPPHNADPASQADVAAWHQALADAGAMHAAAAPAAGQSPMSDALNVAGRVASSAASGFADGIVGMAKGLGHIVAGAYHAATDPNARAKDLQMLQGAGNAVIGAVQHPVATAQAATHAVEGAVTKFSIDFKAAAAAGTAPEFIGTAIGETAAAIGGDLIPGGAEAEAAGALGRTAEIAEAAGKTAEIAEAAGKAGDVAEAGSALGMVGADSSREAAAAETASSAASRGPQVTSDDITLFRNRIGVPGTRTVAVGRTDVPGLEGGTFEGASPRVRQEAGLPKQTPGPVQSPIQNPMFRDHAEQDIANQFVASVERAGLKPSDLKDRTLTIRVDNPNGVCGPCRAGLKDPAKPAGVLKQLSERYPELKIHVVVNNPGPQLSGPAEFTLLKGAYAP